MSFDIFDAIQKATQQWRLAHTVEPKEEPVIITERFRTGVRHHWIAVLEGHYWQGEPQGWGRTEEEAIADLKDQLENR